MCGFDKIGFIETFAGAVTPMGYLSCNGQAVDKVVYKNLYNIIGDLYTPQNHSDPLTFCVPNYNGKTSIGKSVDYPLGTDGGNREVSLTVSNLPAHNHKINAVTATGTSNDPNGKLLSNTGAFDNEYSTGNPSVTMNPNMVSSTGNGLPVNIMQPFLAANYLIYTGI